MIDTHCHLDDERLFPELDKIVKEMKTDGLTKLVNIGVDFESSVKSINLAQEYESIFATVGVHPHNWQNYTDNHGVELLKMSSHAKCVAIGEIGLDYYYPDTDKVEQKKMFEKQLELAHKSGLPIVVHIRDAFKDCLEMLKSYRNKLVCGGVIHCYTGSVESAKILLDLGYYIAFGGAITFKNNHTSEGVIQYVPNERILLETDCPYLAPQNVRGKTNMPKYIVHVLEKIAQIKGIDTKIVDQITTDNAYKIFIKMRTL